jgi:hypothetical protein
MNVTNSDINKLELEGFFILFTITEHMKIVCKNTYFVLNYISWVKVCAFLFIAGLYVLYCLLWSSNKIADNLETLWSGETSKRILPFEIIVEYDRTVSSYRSIVYVHLRHLRNIIKDSEI